MVTENEHWPSLRYDEWKDTYATLHMWTQIGGASFNLILPTICVHMWSVA